MQYRILWVGRSDGKLEIVTKNKVEKNEPTPEQMDRTPDAKGVSDYYKELQPDEMKHLDWRRKLAGMLMRDLKPDVPHDLPFMLGALPENYRLFEHIKSKATDADGKPAASKTHAGGGHDRQDAYLYGNPGGRKKRYRSPADFYPHLLWLCTDKTGDYGNCSCKLCAPDDIQPDAEKQPKVLKQTAAVKKDEPDNDGANSLKRPQVKQAAYVEVPAPKTTTANSVGSSNVVNPFPQRAAFPQQTATLPLPQPQSLDQQIDFEYGKFTFRNGELVWFQRQAGTWGLAVILRRWRAMDKATYLVHPLSYPGDLQLQKVVDSENELRPFLAWSPPDYMHPEFRQGNPTFDSIDWSRMMASLSSEYGEGNLLIDASILAARKIEGSYTLFEPGQVIKSEINIHIRKWNGIYLGPEKIWAGDPVRLRSGTEEVLVVHYILERITSGTSHFTNTTIILVGDRYTVKEAPSARHLPPPQPNLPSRMRKDLDFRNSVSAAVNNGPLLFWELLDRNKTVELLNVRGRWYESSMLLPVLDGPAAFDNARAAGHIPSVSTRLNHRGESKGSNATNLRKNSREDAFAPAIPANIRIMADSIDPPPPQELPQEPQVEQQQQQLDQFDHQHDTGGLALDANQAASAMDDLVDYDQMDTQSNSNNNSINATAGAADNGFGIIQAPRWQGMDGA